MSSLGAILSYSVNKSIESVTSNSSRSYQNIGFAVVAVLIILFIVMQLAGLLKQQKPKVSSGHFSRQMAGDMDDTAIQDLYTSSVYAKAAFLSPKVGTSTPNPDFLKQALDSAESLEYEGANSPGIARRVIILRLLLHKPAFKEIKHKGDTRVVKPVDAYTSDLPASVSPKDKLKYTAEITAWIAADSKSVIPAAQLSQVVHTISTIPGIGWWKAPALMVMYQSQGDVKRSNSAFSSAQNDALLSLLPLGLAVPVILAMVLVGVFLLIFLVARSGPREVGETSGFNPWPVQPSVIQDSERKLGINLLWGIFIFYIIMPELLSAVLTGFDGVSSSHWGRFSGVLTSKISTIQGMSSSNHMLIVVLITAAGYLIGALVPMAVLMIIARKRGASLADELGWHTRNLKRNLLFGALGYCAGLPLLFLAGVIGQSVFKGAAEPTNPAITLLTNSSSTAAQAIMVALATICAPLLEEFFFRGVFYQGARQKFGPAAAIVMTGVIFGLAHPVGAEGMLAIAVLGCVLAWVAESRKSLASSMIGHFLQNIGASMAVILLVSR